MDLLTHLAIGFETAFTFQNVVYVFIGCLLGTFIGVLPGIGPSATIAMLLPITYALNPTTALIMLAGIYYGAQYGGSTTAILINLPGEATSVATLADGYKMAQAGRAGPALAIAALGSFFAGCIGTLLLAGFSTSLMAVAFNFGPAEYFSLMVLGLVGATVLASGDTIKSIGMILLGVMLGLVGTDINTGVVRFDFGIPNLYDGIGFAVLAMGVFGYGEIFYNLSYSTADNNKFIGKISELVPTKQDIKNSAGAVLRGTALGSLFGLIPGAGPTIASFASYSVEKNIKSEDSVNMGEGNIRGVAGPESANNAASQTAFVPLLALGIPATATMALMLGAMTIHDISPGPEVMTGRPELFWGLIVSMWLGNLMLVILNLPLVGIWVKLLTIPYRLLFPGILLFCAIGVYSIGNNIFDIWMLVLFGLCGYLFKLIDLELAPFVLGFILGPMMELHMRRALIITQGDWTIFFTKPISLSVLILSLILLIAITIPKINKLRTILKTGD